MTNQLLSNRSASVPFHQFLCKIHTTCNLNCKYCYVYHHADQSWREKPTRMSDAVINQLAVRIREHVLEFNMPDVDIILHGGEPMLAGAEFIRHFARTLKSELDDVTQVNLGMQSNGTLLTPSLLDVITEEKILVGVSLDGTKEINDIYRVDHRGHSTYASAAEGIARLRDRERLSGVLCTICLDADPVETYHHLLQFQPPVIDFNFPLGHYESPPPSKTLPYTRTPYTDWLIPIFDVWFAQRFHRTRIRLFQDIIGLLLGSRTSVETIGISPIDIVVIETNGTLEAVDTLKIVEKGSAQLGLNLFEHSFSDALKHPMIQIRQAGFEALCETCQRCPLSSVCGGGYFPTRFSQSNGFGNPSIYCADYYKLITHIRSKVISQARDVGILLQLPDLPTTPPIPKELHLAVGER